MIKKILIIGAGQLGSRHLQALKAVKIPLDILVVDPLEESLQKARKRYYEMPKGKINHSLNFKQSIPADLKSVDLAIISSCSDTRAGIIKDLLKTTRVKYLILEKILFNKKSDYNKIEKLLEKNNVKTWINFTRRMQPFYIDINDEFKGQKISYIISGSNYGLVSGAIHFLDHVAYLTGCYDFELNTNGLDPEPIPNKRKGFIEFNGTMFASYGDGSSATINCKSTGNSPIIVEVHGDKTRFSYQEDSNKVWVSRTPEWKWEEINAPFLYQSQLTTKLTEDILDKGVCNLANYGQAKKIHLQMLEPLLKFLNKNSIKKYGYYPFT